jgi:hypothetical protein
LSSFLLVAMYNCECTDVNVNEQYNAKTGKN